MCYYTVDEAGFYFKIIKFYQKEGYVVTTVGDLIKIFRLLIDLFKMLFSSSKGEDEGTENTEDAE